MCGKTPGDRLIAAHEGLTLEDGLKTRSGSSLLHRACTCLTAAVWLYHRITVDQAL